MRINRIKNFYEYNEVLRLGKELFNLCYCLEEFNETLYTKIRVDTAGRAYLCETRYFDIRQATEEAKEKMITRLKEKTLTIWVGGQPDHKP